MMTLTQEQQQLCDKHKTVYDAVRRATADYEQAMKLYRECKIGPAIAKRAYQRANARYEEFGKGK